MRRVLLSLLAASLLAGCRVVPPANGPDLNPGPSTPVKFTVFPVALEELDYIVPLGWLNPPGHTFPSDHMYMIFKDHYGSHALRAPADGIIFGVYHQPQEGDYKIFLRHSPTVMSYIDHVKQLAPFIRAAGSFPDGMTPLNLPIVAGETLGTSSTANYGIWGADFGMSDDTVTQAFAHPLRYNQQTRHTDSPLRRYEGALRDSLYALVRRDAPDKDGRIAFDIPGKLIGNWFLGNATDMDWTKHLAFVYDPLVPSQARIVCGGEVGLLGTFAIREAAPRFEEVGSTNGTVRYALIGFDPGQGGRPSAEPIRGTVLVRLLADDSLRVEARLGTADTSEVFTSAAKIFTR